MTINLDEIREQAQEALAQAEHDLAALRQQRANINADIKAQVAVRDDAKSIVAKLTPRTRKTKSVEDGSTPGVVG